MDGMQSDSPSSSRQDAVGGGAESGKAAVVNIKKLREEMEMTKARLSDQKFKISKSLHSSPGEATTDRRRPPPLTRITADYPDPLLPRKSVSPKASPSWVNIESEEHLKCVIAKIAEASSA